MPIDEKISQVNEALAVVATDQLAIVTSGPTTKKITVDTLFSTANDLWQGWVLPNDADWVGSAGLPLTSTDWDGDAHSTTAKTLIDLSVKFNVPAGVRAVLVRAAVRDEASAATANLFLLLSPNNTSGSYVVAYTASGQPNDGWVRAGGQMCPCDANGDVYYQIAASGAGTFDVTLEIWGYLF